MLVTFFLDNESHAINSIDILIIVISYQCKTNNNNKYFFDTTIGRSQITKRLKKTCPKALSYFVVL